MTDDLVQTLRRPNGILDWQYRLKCADRIEAQDAYIADVVKGQSVRIQELEAALREIINTPWADVDVNGSRIHNVARRALEGK